MIPGARNSSQEKCNDSVRLAFACSAHCSYWALWTLRLAPHTDQRPQLHHGLIELPGALAVLGDELPRQSPHRRCTLHVARDRKGAFRVARPKNTRRSTLL